MEVFIGAIELFAFDYAPNGWVLCDGRLLEVQKNQALFALLSTRYGGDGRTTFGLPDLSKSSPLPNVKFYMALQGYWPPQQ